MFEVQFTRHATVVTRQTSPLTISRAVDVPVSPAAAFRPIRRIGGRAGWYYANWLWRFRGWLDVLAGGAGMGRGRPDPDHLQLGDVLDRWRVTRLKPDRLLELSAEMRLPGRGWLEFEVEPSNRLNGSRIQLRATFEPASLWGRVYWRLLGPFHALLFGGLLRRIASQAVAAP